MATDALSAGPRRRHRVAVGRVGPLPVAVGLAARVVVAGLTVAMAAIHLHLWSTGYKHVHIIGVLFLLNGIVGIALAAAVLLSPTRLLAGAAAAVTGFTVGTLLGLVFSLTTGLLGFKEFAGAPFLDESIVVESVGIAAAALLTALYARTTLAWWHHRAFSSRPPRPG